MNAFYWAVILSFKGPSFFSLPFLFDILMGLIHFQFLSLGVLACVCAVSSRLSPWRGGAPNMADLKPTSLVRGARFGLPPFRKDFFLFI